MPSRSAGPCSGARRFGFSRAVPFDDSVPVGPVSDTLIDELETEVTPSDLVVIIHTSGTSADPKGVLHTHGAVVRHSQQLARWGAPSAPLRYIGTEERTLLSQPFFWVAGLIQDLLAMLHVGGTMLLQDRFDADAAWQLVQREHATKISQATYIRFLARPDVLEKLGSLKSLRLPTSTGPRHGACGMTETLSNHTHPQGEFDNILPPHLTGSAGKPVPFMQHRIVDPDTGHDVEEGTPGLLLVRGYALMAGMNKREREEVFDENGWYPTGDQCMMRNGYLFFVDRYGGMIKTSGANVSPAEVEKVLLSMPEIAQATVVGIPDAARGQLVAAAVVAAPGSVIDVSAVVSRAKQQLSTFKVPKKLKIYTDDEFPRLANGKPDKLLLLEAFGDEDEPPR